MPKKTDVRQSVNFPESIGMSHSLRVLLAMSVLVANMGFQSGIAHSHAHGGTPHDHPIAKTHNHSQQHSHTHASDAAASFAGDSQPHVHVSLFGLGFSLVSEGSPDYAGQHTYSSCIEQIFVVAKVAQHFGVASQQQVTLTFDNGDLLGDHHVAIGALLFSPGTAPICFLCDTARHERSGVLLA